jgi:hypothetical protein
MKIRIDVLDRQEGTLITRALLDPLVRAFVTVMGAWLALPSHVARVQALRVVEGTFAEEDVETL